MTSIVGTLNATRKPNPRLSILAAPIALLCSLLIGNAPAMAQTANGRCSNRILRGDYAFSGEGFYISGSTALPLKGVVMRRFDGKGNVSQVDHIVFNGMPPATEWTPGAGTYTVNPDCTGSAQITIPGAPSNPLILRFVVSRGGRQIFDVVSKPGYVVGGVGSRLSGLADDEQ